MKVENWTQRYDISWSKEHGWRVRVEVHDSVMCVDELWKVFGNCDSAEHAFALAHDWAKTTLATIEEHRKR